MKYTKREFSIACGIKTKDLSNYISRGKVFVENDKIDGDLEINKSFLIARQEFNKTKEVAKPPVVKIEPAADSEKKLNERSADKSKEVQSEFKFPKEHNPAQIKNFELDTEIKRQNLEKEKIAIQLQQAKLDKINGVTIPTELVKTVFIHHTKSITVAFHNGAETLLSKIAKLKGLDISEMADLRTELITIVNEAVDSSIAASKKTVESIVAEYSQKKDVGERE
jgi:antitoxin component of MazEF toxin-antitoxin module